ncbi:MAG: VTT domain-containing protein [Clostridia bacterium]|nr:VTT domain-containing protein [Clostridia bacterium]
MDKKKNYDKLVKALQIVSAVFMLATAVVCVVLLKKYNISIKNASELSRYLSGGVFTVAAVLIGFSVVKSFALVFPPAILFALSGIVFDSYPLAVTVNMIATALSLILPYWLGRFTGKGMAESLSKRFKAVKKLDDFASANDFALVLVFKAGGLMPSDLSSLIFGALNIPFGRYFLAANIGMLPLNFLWTLLGFKGDLANPLSYLYVLPILVFAVVAAAGIKFYQKRKNPPA